MSDDEKDLFGSSDEDDAPRPLSGSAAASGGAPKFASDQGSSAPASRGGGAASSSAAAAAPGAGAGADDDDDFDDKDLFGSDDDAASQAPSRRGSTVVSDEERELFGDEAAKEMDERDIFGEVSEEEEVKAEEVTLRRRAAPSKGRTFTRLKLPNIVSFDKQAFNRETFDPEVRAQSLLHEHLVKGNKEVVKLTLAENCIRWRFKKDKDGNILKDAQGNPQYESNARFVEWEDGSMHFQIGEETFHVLKRQEEKQQLFDENINDVMVCQGFLQQSIVITPLSLEANTHRRLKNAQFNKVAEDRRSLLLTMEEQAQSTEKNTIENERTQKRRRLDAPQREGAMDAAFLEDDDAPIGPSIADIKKTYKSGASQAVEEMAARHLNPQA